MVGKFVEYFGHGLVVAPARRPRHDREHVAGVRATCGFFPVDEETLRYLRLTGRSAGQVELVEAYFAGCRASSTTPT